MIRFGYKNDTSWPVFRGIISIVEVVFWESPSVIPTDFVLIAPVSYGGALREIAKDITFWNMRNESDKNHYMSVSNLRQSSTLNRGYS